MKIILLQSFGFSEPGDVLDPDPPVAQLLIDRGIAQRVSAVSVAKAVPSAPRDKAIGRRTSIANKQLHHSPAD